MARSSARRSQADHKESAPIRPARESYWHYYLIALFVVFVASLASEAPHLAPTVRTAGAGFWVLVGLAIVADTPIFRVQRRGSSLPVLTSVTFCYALSYGWGHGTARIVQAMAILVASVLAGRGLWSITYDVGRYGLALGGASEMVTLIGRPTPFGSGPAVLVGVLVGAVAWYATFRLLTATGTWLYRGGSWKRSFLRDLPAEAPSAAALLLLSPMLLLVARSSVWLIPLVLAPIFAVSQLAQVYARLKQRATHDPMTGLPNRFALYKTVEGPIQSCADRQPDAGMVALLVADIAQLGRVNEALGHRVGDEVVVAAGHRLSDWVGPRVAVARLQSDEFAISIWELSDVAEALECAAALRAQFDEPVTVDGQPLSISLSIGISLCPLHGTSYDDLERHADTAMERAKSLPERTAIFQPDRDAPAGEQISLLSDLRQALDEPETDQITTFYQPQLDMSTGEVVGVEALLRWQHPSRGMISPEHVMRIAEYSPFMRRISMTILEQVLVQLASWRAEGWVLHASVNVSVRDIHGDDLITWLDGRLRHYRVAPSQLQLELTEHALMSHLVDVLDSLRHLRRIGVGASLDDFGTGFSSLQHLRQLPLTEIKIDQSFVKSMLESPQDEAIVRAVIGLGRDLGLRVVAEGVEDEQTRMKLLADGCRVAQGWYYAPPMPAHEFSRWRIRSQAHA